jgi:acyl carrier protein
MIDHDRPVMALAEFHAAVVRHLHSSRAVEADVPIDSGANLFDLGYLDSLHMVELVLFLEEMLGISIELERLDPRAFHTTQRMYEAFVAPAARP